MAEVNIHAPGVKKVKSLCRFCHVGCGVIAYVKDGDVIKIEGDPDYANQGALCARGTSALLHLNHPARVNHVLKRVGEKGEGKWEQIDYDTAIQEVADRLNRIKEESGAEAVASAGGTTRTEDWVRRRFLNQFGTPNGFRNSFLCWIPSFLTETCVAGWSPFETDFGNAECIILWGANPGATTLSGMKAYSDLKETGVKIIVIDPRYSETASKADMWLPLRPGSDDALALAMLNTIMYGGMCDYDFIDKWCSGYDELMAHIEQYTPEWASEITGLEPDIIRKAATTYAMKHPGCIQWSCTLDQLGPASTTTTHTLTLLRAVTGNLEIPGGDGMPGPALDFLTDQELELNRLFPEEMKAKQITPFKLTSWEGYTKVSENAMRQWGKTIPSEWFCMAHGPSVFKAIITGDPYPIRALICNNTNPVSSYGDAKMVLEALKRVEFLVVVDYWVTPTALFADYVFPAASALERPTVVTIYGVTDSLMAGSRAIQPKYDRHDDYQFWKRLGLACGQNPANWPWDDIEDAYWDVVKPIGFPVETYDEFVDKVRVYYPPLRRRKFESHNGFWTPSRKVEMNSSIMRELGLPGMPTYIGSAENPIDTPELLDEYPLMLSAGGGFMPFHHSEHYNMPNMRYIYPEPYFSINVDTAESLGIEYGDWCWIETRRGRIKMRANADSEIAPGNVFCPRGWWFPERDGSADLNNPFGCLESNVNTLTSVDIEHCDPMCGNWAIRGILCKVYKCEEDDQVFTAEDAQFSIPGSSSKPGVSAAPSTQRLAREPVQFQPPECDREVPDGYYWVWQDDGIYNKKTHYRLDESGWEIDPKTNGYVDPQTGWVYNSAAQCLVDETTGKKYDLDRKPITFFAGLRTYPGLESPPYEIPSNLTWDSKLGYARLGDKMYIYDWGSGWMIDPYTNVYYDAVYGYAYDPHEKNLLDEATGKRYTMSYEPIDADSPIGNYEDAEDDEDMETYEFTDALTNDIVTIDLETDQIYFEKSEAHIDELAPCKSVFFPGCSAINYAMPIIFSIYEILLDKGVADAISLLCCGKILEFEPNGSTAKELFDHEFCEHVVSIGLERIVCLCPNCVKELRNVLMEDERTKHVKVQALPKLIAEKGIVLEKKAVAKMIKGDENADVLLCPHDSCPDRESGDFADGLRSIMGDVPWVDPKHCRNLSICCGASVRGMGNEAGAEKCSNICGTESVLVGADAMVTTCFSCDFQLNASQSHLPAYHFLELIYGHKIEWSSYQRYMTYRFLFDSSLGAIELEKTKRVYGGLGREIAEGFDYDSIDEDSGSDGAED